MVKDPEATFRELFGEEFARAYEEQLRQLKARRAATAHAAEPDGSDRSLVRTTSPLVGVDPHSL